MELYKNGHVFDNGIIFLEYVPRYKGRGEHVYAKFKCRCGNEYITQVCDVKAGRSNSCRKCPKNIIEDYDENTYKITYNGNGKYKGVSGLIDKEWYHIIVDDLGFNRNWYPKKSCTTKSLSWCFNDNKKQYRVHSVIGKYILGCDNNKYTVDHLNRNELDNSKNNIRVATRSEQCYNVGRYDNKLGYRGVYHMDSPNVKLYVASIQINYKRVRVYFHSKDKAALAVNYMYDVLNIHCPRNTVISNTILTKKDKDYILAELQKTLQMNSHLIVNTKS